MSFAALRWPAALWGMYTGLVGEVMASLQQAYDGGASIAVDSGQGPVSISEAGAGVAQLVSMVASLGAICARFQQTAAVAAVQVVGGSADAIQVDMTGVAAAYAAVQVAADALNQVGLAITAAGITSSVRGDGLVIAQGGAGVDEGRVVTGDNPVGAFGTGSPSLVIGTGNAALGSNCGGIQIGFADDDDAASQDGGFALQPDTGRMFLRVHRLAAPGVDAVGVLKLHEMTSSQFTTFVAASGAPLEGDTFLQIDDSGASARDKGFRAYRNSQWGLLGRVYQRTFTDADLVAGVLTVDHVLDCEAVGVFVYSDTGAAIPYDSSATTVSLQQSTADQTLVTFGASLLPLSGTWRVTVLGV